MTRIAYLGAPLLLLGYGVAHLIDGLDGSHGPGPAWTIGHLLFLASMLLFVAVLFAMRAALPGGRAARGIAAGAVAVGVVGLIAFIRGIAVDLIVGLRSADRPAMNRLYPHYDSFPGGLPKGLTSALSTLGPVFLMIGLLTLSIQLAALRPRRLRWWSPVLAAAGFAAISAELDLLPLGGLLLLLALAPLARRVPAAGAAGATDAGQPTRAGAAS
ncbi:hypothetical protein GCM10023322_57920 [Rugosimonospora acidiphila]|uniref:Uncharacterized protein n=1 Tax=Rugosimonospora acidiphila TaxID=556531 RepID=A0ABP9SET7_9ACTN